MNVTDDPIAPKHANNALLKWALGILSPLLVTSIIGLFTLFGQVRALEARVQILEAGGARFSARDAKDLRVELERKIEKIEERCEAIVRRFAKGG